MGPMNGFFSTGGGGICGASPFDLMEIVRRTPHGSFFTYQTTFDAPNFYDDDRSGPTHPGWN